MPRRRSRFRPCIDLHDGKVKQIVGGTLKEGANSDLKTNHVSEHSPAWFARLYRHHDLQGGHVIKLGSGNDDAAREALQAWPGQLQIGGGINESNAKTWIDAGASKVIVTSYLFPNARFDKTRLETLSKAVGAERLVVDVSCRKKGDKWIVAMNKWQDLTDVEVNQESLDLLSSYCSEFLVHAADVEGLCQGIDSDLVQRLGEWSRIPVTYAGGAKAVDDLILVDTLSNGKVDLTYGSSLDIFGGTVVFEELAELDEDHRTLSAPKRFNAWSIFTAAATVAVTAGLYRGDYISTRAAIILVVSALFQLSWVVQSSES